MERGLNSGAPRVRKAAERLADATSSLAVRDRLLADTQRRVADQSKAVADAQDRVNQRRRSGLGLGASLARDEERLAAARRDSAKADRDLVRDSASAERAIRRRTSAIRDFEDALRSSERTMRNHRRSHGGQAANSLGGIFTSIPFVPGGKAGAIIGTGLVTVLGSVADAAVTASQALWLLPAAALAGGAAFGTLKLGLSGFFKSLQDMGDAKKFAQDLQGLAPNAQQAALEIQALSKAVGGLKTLVQNKLFEGVAQQLHNLGNTFLPTLKNMFSGVAGAFNEMFQGATNQLMTPGTASNIASIVNNIVGAFRNLAPAMGPVVDAFTKIAQVGSTFLPGMGTALTNLATKFDNFITKAQQSGQLQQWIQKGIDAASSLGKVIGEIAHKIYDVFGNKSPQQFQSTLQGMVGAATAVAQAIQGVSTVVNALLRDIQPIATAIGGWPNLIWAVVAAWGAWKVGGAVLDILNIGKALGGLPTIAESVAGRVSAALAGIAMPSWMATLLPFLGGAGVVAAGAGAAYLGSQYTNAQEQKRQQKMGQIGNLSIPAGLPKPGSDQAAQAMGSLAAQGDPGAQWVVSAKNAQDQAQRYAWLMNNQGADKPGFKPPTSYGLGAGNGNAPQGGGKRGYFMSPWFGGGAPGQDPYAPIMPPSAGLAPYSPLPVPAVPGKKKGKKGKLPKAYTPYGSDFTAPPRPGETPEEYSAEGEVLNAKHRLAQDRQTLLEMEKSNNATADQIQEQKNKIAEDQRQQYEAEMRLTQAQQNAVKKNIKGLKKANDEFNNIDQDFGLSQGLPGLVKNLVGMIGDIAAAPLMGPLQAVANAYGTGSDQFGMFGMMAAGNRSKGLSPLLGIAPGMPGGPSLGAGRSGVLGEGSYGAGSGIYAMPGITSTGGVPAVPGGVGLASATRPMGTGKAAMAKAIYSSVIQAGYSPQTAQSAVAASLLESGLNPNITNASGHHGLFQESADKPSAGAGQQISWFLNALGAAGGPGIVNQDPTDAIADRVERGGYSGSRYNQFMGQARALLSGWTPKYDDAAGPGAWVQGASLAGAYSPMGGSTGTSGILGGGFAGGVGGLPAFGNASMVPLAPNVEAGIRAIGGLPQVYPTSGPGAYQVPAWAKALAARFGLTASTYATGGSLHQMGYAMDFNGPAANQDAFAQYIEQYLKGATLQLIHQSPLTGQDYGIASGQSVGPGTSMPGYYSGDFPGHRDHVHWAPDVAGGTGLVGYSRPNGAHSGIFAGSFRPAGFDVDPFNGVGVGGDSGSNAAKQLIPHYQPGGGPVVRLPRVGPGINPRVLSPGTRDIIGAPTGYRTAGDYGGVRLVDKSTPIGTDGGAASFGAPGSAGVPGYQPGLTPNVWLHGAAGNAGIGLGKPPTIPGHAAGPPVPPSGGPRTRSGAAIPPPGGTGAPPKGIANAAPPAPAGPPPNQGWQPSGSGGNGLGGLPESAIIAGASMFPGGGAAAQMGMKLINRTIGYGQQAAAIGMEGLLQTFGVHDPDGGGGLGDLSKSWYGRILSGFAGARPAIGSGAAKKQPAKKSPQDEKGGPKGKPGSDGTTHNNNGINIHGSPGANINIHPAPQDNGSMQKTSDALSLNGAGVGGAPIISV